MLVRSGAVPVSMHTDVLTFQSAYDRHVVPLQHVFYTC